MFIHIFLRVHFMRTENMQVKYAVNYLFTCMILIQLICHLYLLWFSRYSSFADQEKELLQIKYDIQVNTTKKKSILKRTNI